jgi:ferredoxin
MVSAVVKFEREGRDGLVAVGSYLVDAMNRLGVRLGEKCDPAANIHHCRIAVRRGMEFLSPLSAFETEHLSSTSRKANERLACEAKIISAGEIVLMTEEKKQEPVETEPKSKLVNEFEALPLEKKIADLMRMEAVTLGETITFVLNSPYMVFEKIGDVLADFGMKMDRESKKGPGPAADEPKAKSTATKPKAAAPKRPSSNRARKPAKE